MAERWQKGGRPITAITKGCAINKKNQGSDHSGATKGQQMARYI